MEGLVALLPAASHIAERDNNHQSTRDKKTSPPKDLEINRTVLYEVGIYLKLWRGKIEKKQKELARWPKIVCHPMNWTISSIPAFSNLQQVDKNSENLETHKGEDTDKPGSGASEVWNTKWRSSRNHRVISQATELSFLPTSVDLLCVRRFQFIP